MNKKIISVVVALATIGSLALAMSASAAMMPRGGRGFGPGMMGQRPAVVGTVTAVSGNTITVTSKHGDEENQTTTTFTVDATNAKITKNNAAGTIASILVGDTVLVQGTVSGTNVTATAIRDGIMISRMGMDGHIPGVFGTVAVINGTSLTVTGKTMPGQTTAPTTYMVDASNATVMKNGATSSVSAIVVGDTVMIQGTVSGTSVTAKTIRDGVVPMPGGQGQPMMQGNGQPVVAGKITAISGNTITITNASNVTYTIDATNAKIMVDNQTSSISNIAVGDNVLVQGMVNGSSVTASSVIDQKAPANPGANSNNPSGAPKPMMGGVGGMLGGIANFFKHMFGF